MGEKKNNNNNGGGENKKKKEEPKSVTAVLKVDMHCEGCASKMVKILRSFDGVETVKAETAENKLMLTGFIDPSKICEMLRSKTKKKVELISPQPKKVDKENNNGGNNNNKPKQENNKSKEKEAPVSTAVLKLSFHCQGCIEKIGKTVAKFKGVHDMSMDKQKDLVTVKGTMDVKALVETLKEKLKKPVQIVPLAKKENDGGDDGGGKKKKGGGDDGGGKEENKGNGNGGGKIVDQVGNRMEYMVGPSGFGYEYGYPYPNPIMQYNYQFQLHAPQMFSEENPNACSVM